MEENQKDIIISEEPQKKTSGKGLQFFFYAILIVAVGACGYFAGILHERSGTTAGNYTTQALKIKKINEIIHENYYFQDEIDDEEAFDYAMAGYVNHLKEE